MLELLKSIPEVVWAAVLASILTLSGVLLSNRNSKHQTRTQLEHDSNQRDREREMSLRKDVYLRAAEAISKGHNLLTRLTDLNLSEQEIGADFYFDSAALSKIQVVGTNRTVQAVSAFSQELATAYLELLLKRAPLIDRKNTIDLLSQFIDKSQGEQDSHIKLMKQLNLDGNSDQRVWKVLNENFEFEKQQHKDYSNEREELWAIQNTEHIRFVELCLSKFMGVSKLIPATVFAMREELELPIDEETYLAAFNESNKKGMNVFQSFLKEAEQLIDT